MISVTKALALRLPYVDKLINQETPSLLKAATPEEAKKSAITAGIIFLCLLIFTFDISTPFETAAGLAYLPIVMCSLLFRTPHTAFFFCLIASLLSLLGFFLFVHNPPVNGVFILNRFLTIGVLWCIATLIYLSRSSNLEHQKTERRLQALVKTTINAIITFYPNGKIESYNPATLRIFGYTDTDLQNIKMQALCPELYNSLPQSRLPENTRNMKEEEIRSIFVIGKETKAIRKDGTSLPVHFSMVGIKVGEETLFTTIVTDISDPQRSKMLIRQYGEDLEKQNMELAQSNKELENFAYVVSHDLQEPLRMVRSYCELLNEKYKNKLDKEGEEFLAFAVDGASRMQRMIGDLLVYSRASRHELKRQETSLKKLLEDVIQNIRQCLEESKAHIIVEKSLPNLWIEPVMIEQVLQNLICNAIKFQKAGNTPEIRIGAHKTNDGTWVVSITDNGIGFDPKYNTKIFEMFQRLHSRDKYEGTGIGLAICQRIIERHGGHIWAESTPGQGSVFSFSIPDDQQENLMKAA